MFFTPSLPAPATHSTAEGTGRPSSFLPTPPSETNPSPYQLDPSAPDQQGQSLLSRERPGKLLERSRTRTTSEPSIPLLGMSSTEPITGCVRGLASKIACKSNKQQLKVCWGGNHGSSVPRSKVSLTATGRRGRNVRPDCSQQIKEKKKSFPDGIHGVSAVFKKYIHA